MRTKEVLFDSDLYLIVPDDPSFYWPTNSTSNFPTCCGPEKWSDKFYIFDKMLGLCVSPACFVHDRMWELAEPTWRDYHYSNSVFLHNLLTIINARSRCSVAHWLRKHKAFAYYDAIDMRGAKYFWEYKAQQGYDTKDRKR